MVLEETVVWAIEHPEWGWTLVVAGGIYQLFAPWETKVKKLGHGVKEEVEAVKQRQLAQMTVIRALARVQEDIDTEEVDKYLVENGMDPEDFVVRRHRTDGGIDGED